MSARNGDKQKLSRVSRSCRAKSVQGWAGVVWTDCVRRIGMARDHAALIGGSASAHASACDHRVYYLRWTAALGTYKVYNIRRCKTALAHFLQTQH